MIRFFLALWLLWSFPAMAAETITMRTGTHDNMDRLVLDWNSQVDYQLSGQAPNYTLTFGEGAEVAIPALGKLKRFANVEKTSAEPLTLSIRLADGNALHVSRVGSRIVIDAAQDNRAAKKPEDKKQTAKKEDPKKPEKKAEAPAGDAAVIQKKIDQAVQVAPWSENQDIGGKAPAKEEPKPATAPAPVAAAPAPDKAKEQAAPPPAPQGDVGPGGRPLTLAELAQREAEKKAATPAPATPNDKPATPADAATKPADQQETFLPLPTVMPDPTAVAQIKLKVPPKIKFAAYMRGKRFWLVLDQPNTENPTDENGGEPSKFGPVTRYQVGQGSGTAYRIQLKENQYPAITKTDDGELLFTVYQQMPLVMPVSLPIEIDNSKEQGPRLKINGTGFAPPFRVSDPDIGDQVFVIPAAPEAGTVTEARRWPQVATLPAIHGIVVNPIVDNIIVDSNPTGAIIARPPKGLSVSGVQGLIKNRDQIMGEQIFDFQKWRIGPPSKFRSLKAQLESALADVRGAERLGRIMQIAQFMFAQGFGHEANGWLRMAALEFPNVTTVPEYLLLRGAVHVVMRDLFAADRDLAQPGYAYEPEVALWRAWAAAQNEDYSRARYFFAIASTLLHEYPLPYFKPIAFAAAETGMLTGDVVAGQAMIARLEKLKDLTPNDKGQLDYLRGLEARLNGQPDEAEKYWDKARKSKNVMYAVKAEILSVQEGLKNKKIEPKEAEKRLEKLRYNWRGDRTELAILTTLADLYINDDKPRPAFECWQSVIRYFPNDPLAEIARQNISKNFVELFRPQMPVKIEPIEALALYRDFATYAPSQEAEDIITRKLTDHLAAYELFHEAAAVFHAVVVPKTDRGGPVVPPKADDVLRLAGMYLLDNQTAKAREVLALIPRASLPADQEAQHRLLSARADFEDKNYDGALDNISTLFDVNAQRLRADIYWRKQDWVNTAKTIPILIGEIPADGKLTPEQARLILQQAVALSLANDAGNLDALREHYSAMMDATEQAASFRLITRPPKGSEVQSVKSIQSRLGEVDSFSEFMKANQKKAVPAEVMKAKDAAEAKPEAAAKPEEKK